MGLNPTSIRGKAHLLAIAEEGEGAGIMFNLNNSLRT